MWKDIPHVLLRHVHVQSVHVGFEVYYRFQRRPEHEDDRVLFVVALLVSMIGIDALLLHTLLVVDRVRGEDHHGADVIQPKQHHNGADYGNGNFSESTTPRRTRRSRGKRSRSRLRCRRTTRCSDGRREQYGTNVTLPFRSQSSIHRACRRWSVQTLKCSRESPDLYW